MVAVLSAFFIVVLGLVTKARLKKPRTGREELMGEIGLAVTDIDTAGRVSVHGEHWQRPCRWTLSPKAKRSA